MFTYTIRERVGDFDLAGQPFWGMGWNNLREVKARVEGLVTRHPEVENPLFHVIITTEESDGMDVVALWFRGEWWEGPDGTELAEALEELEPMDLEALLVRWEAEAKQAQLDSEYAMGGPING